MRVAVLIFGILGSLGAAVLAGLYVIGQAAAESLFKMHTSKTPREATTVGVDQSELLPPWTLSTAQEWLDDYHWRGLCIWFLLAAFALGIFGAILGFNRRGFSAAALLFAAFAGPLLVNPGIMTALFPVLLALAGLLALFVKPLPSASGALE